MAQGKVLFQSERVRQMYNKLMELSEDTNLLRSRIQAQVNSTSSELMGKGPVQQTQQLINRLTMEAEDLAEVVLKAINGVERVQRESMQESNKIFDKAAQLAKMHPGMRAKEQATQSNVSFHAFIGNDLRRFIERVKDLAQPDPLEQDPVVKELRNRLKIDGLPDRYRIEAETKLKEIFDARNYIAQAQKAYEVYKIFGNEKWMNEVHAEAEACRKVLRDMGIDEKYIDASTDLKRYFKGSALMACKYNPYKTDGSLLPVEEGLRLVIALGMVSKTYREWAIKHYDQIEAQVKRAEEQKRQFQALLDELNRSVSKKDIEEMQRHLKEMKIYNGEITGEYNEEFYIAVAGYQYIANTMSSVAQVNGYHFEVDGRIDKNLLYVARAENGLGYRNEPLPELSGFANKFSTYSVGIGEGIVTQLGEDAWEIAQGLVPPNPLSPQNLIKAYNLGAKIAAGEFTMEEIRELAKTAASAVGSGLEEEFETPFVDIQRLSPKILNGTATYEESVEYGRAVIKAAQVLAIAGAAIKTGAKLSVKVSTKVQQMGNELIEDIASSKVKVDKVAQIMKKLKEMELNEASQDKLLEASQKGLLDPTQWKGKITATNKDLTNLTDEKLKELDQLLKDGKNIDDAQLNKLKGIEGTGNSYKTVISDEMKDKILLGQRKDPAKKELIGGHSPEITNSHPDYAVEVVSTNADGTRKVKFTTQFPDGNLSKIKTSTLFPESWSDEKILDSIAKIGDTPMIGQRARDGATLHRGIVDGVQIEVIKIGDNVVSGYPTGGGATSLLSGFQ